MANVHGLKKPVRARCARPRASLRIDLVGRERFERLVGLPALDAGDSGRGSNLRGADQTGGGTRRIPDRAEKVPVHRNAPSREKRTDLSPPESGLPGYAQAELGLSSKTTSDA
jgi:hypothetical protein